MEFATPSGASKAKSMMDKIENEMRPDHRSRQEVSLYLMASRLRTSCYHGWSLATQSSSTSVADWSLLKQGWEGSFLCS